MSKNVLVIEKSGDITEALSQSFTESDIEFLSADSVERVKQLISESPFHLIVFDAAQLPDGMLTLLHDLKSKPFLEFVPILALTEVPASGALETLIRPGFDDFIRRPFLDRELATRAEILIKRGDLIQDYARRQHDSKLILDLTQTLISSHDIREILFKVVSTIAEELVVDRCSIILTRQERDYGFVIVSSDDEGLTDLPINLSRYPEIIEVLDQQKPIFFGDVQTSPLFARVRDRISEARVASSALFPIALEDQAMGVIFLRFLTPRKEFGEREIHFCQTVANATAIALRNAEIVAQLRERTRQIQTAHLQVERQLEHLRRYEDFFLSAVDGMIVTNREERILYSNPKATTITGRSAASLKELSFRQLFIKEEDQRLTNILTGLLGGDFPREVDVRGYGPRGEERIFSLSSASLKGMENTFLWTLRDVTETRRTTEKLGRAQKRLIESEKRSAVMELSGAAAHELNQPIQSMVATIGLVRKFGIPNEKMDKAIATLETELDRLSDIVRQIGRITQYETKAYLGQTQIIDLEKSAGPAASSRTGDVPGWMEQVPLPAFIIDPLGVVRGANSALGRILPLEEIAGNLFTDIFDLTGGALVWPSIPFLAEAPSFPVNLKGDRFSLHLASYASGYCGFIVPAAEPVRRPIDPVAENLSDSERSVSDRLLRAFLYLARELNLMMREEELIYLFANTFQTLLPGRLVCIRLVDPDTGELSQVYANGKLNPDRRTLIEISQQGIDDCPLVEKAGEELLSQSVVGVTSEYIPLFEHGRSGFDVPLYDGTTLYGLLNIEYENVSVVDEKDKGLAQPLSQQMTWAVRNAKLLSDSLYLRDYVEKLLDSANAPVLVIDKDRKIEVVNRAVERISGFDRDEILGREIEWILNEQDHQRILPVISNALRGESMSNIEVSLPRKQGDEVKIAFNTAPIIGALGETDGVIFVGQDLTELRKLQEQVIHSEKLATLGQLAAGVVHELNNPLTSITVYSNYLIKKLSAANVEEGDIQKLSRILEGAERILQFTKSLVAYARPSGEKPVEIRVADLLSRSFSFCEHFLSRAGTRVTLEIPEDLKPVFGVEDQLQQVLINLITNACHALPTSGGAITAKAEEIEDGRICISIADNGHGIPAELKEQIFEPFFTTKPVGVGTGLGLSIVRNIIMNHHGEIRVESEPGKGSTFLIYLYPAK